MGIFPNSGASTLMLIVLSVLILAYATSKGRGDVGLGVIFTSASRL